MTTVTHLDSRRPRRPTPSIDICCARDGFGRVLADIERLQCSPDQLFINPDELDLLLSRWHATLVTALDLAKND